MKSISQYLTEAIKNGDFNSAAKIMRKYLAKNGHASTMHTVGFDQSGQETISFLGWNKDFTAAASINFNVGENSTAPNSITFFNDTSSIIKLIGDIACGNSRNSYATTLYEVDAINTLQVVKAVNEYLTTCDAKTTMDNYYSRMYEGADDNIESTITEAKYAEEVENLDSYVGLRKSVKAKLNYLNYVRQRAEKKNDTAALEKIDAIINDLGGTSTAPAANPNGNPTTTRVKPDKYADQKAFEEMLLGKYSLIEKMQDMCRYTEIMCKKNNPNVAVFSGAPGIGKTYNVEKILEKNRGKMNQKIDGAVGWTRVAGDITPSALYVHLLRWRDIGNIVVFDDCDNVFDDKVAANLVKGACDTGKTRVVGWNKNVTPQIDADDYTRLIDELTEKYGAVENIPKGYEPIYKEIKDSDFYFAPKNFEFRANCIILTNMSLSKVPAAIKNRGTCMDLDSTEEEKLELIKSVKDVVKSANDNIILTPEIRDFTFDAMCEYAIALDKAKAQGMNVKGSVTIRSFLTACECAAGFWDSGLTMEQLKRDIFKKILSENSDSGSHL